MADDNASEARVKTVYLTAPVIEKLDEYAEKNNLTRSAAIAEVVAAVANGMPVPTERQKIGQRVTFWVREPKQWLAFQRFARKRGVTQGLALSAALEELT